MAIQKDSKIFPHVIPPTPTETDFSPENFKNLLYWCRDLNQTLTELNRQIVDKYNYHISGTHSHPAAWQAMRIRRPSYLCDDSGTDITVPASVDKPIYFVINGELIEVTDDLVCDLSDPVGPGALDEGTIQQNTPYYLYGIKSSGTVAIMASDNAPGDDGPTGYEAWTYIGACATDEVNASFVPFKSQNGFYQCVEEIEVETEAKNSVVAQQHTFASMPTTADKVWVQVVVDAEAAADAETCIIASCVPASGSYDTILCRSLLTAGGAGRDNYADGWVPIIEAGVVYITSSTNCAVQLQMCGWQEDPTEYK